MTRTLERTQRGQGPTLILMALLMAVLTLSMKPVPLWAAANLSNLVETPLDRTSYATRPAYKNQSFVFGGVLANTSGTQLFLALGDGGLGVFNYDTTTPAYGLVARSQSYEWIGNEESISPVAVAGIDTDGDGEKDYIFTISGPYLLAYSYNATTTNLQLKDRVSIRDPNNQSVTYQGLSIDAFSSGSKYYVLVGGGQVSGTGGALFVLEFDTSTGQWMRSGGEADFDVFQLAYPAYAVEHFTALIKGSSQVDYLAVTGPNILDVFSISPSGIGGTNSQDAISYAIGKSFGAVGQSVVTYTNSKIHEYTTPDANETLIFVGTDSGIYAFELDSEDNSTLDMREFGNISQDIDTLNVKGIYAANVTDSFRDSWLVASAGSKGIYVFKAIGNSTLETDTLALQYIARLDTTGEANGIIGATAANTTAIKNVFIADGGGGLKAVNATHLDDDSSRALSLVYQWDESVAPVDCQAIDDYVVSLDQSGGIQVHTIGGTSTAPGPMEETGSQGGWLGMDLAWSSRGSAFGTGSSLAGEPRGLWVSGNSTHADVFVAAGSGGVKYLELNDVNTTAPSVDFPSNGKSFKTDGEALAVHGFKSGTDFIIGVADGDAGVMFLEKPSGSDFIKKSKVHINGTAQDIYLVSGLGSEDYAFVAYGSQGLVLFKITQNTGGSADYLTNPELVATLDLGGTVTKVRVVSQVANGATKYYAYCLVHDPNDPSVRKIVPVDVTNPSAAAVVTDGTNPVSYPGNNSLNPVPAGIVDFEAVSGNNRYYLVVASTEKSTGGGVGASQVFTVNITNPAAMLFSNAISVTYEARSISTTESGGSKVVLVGELGGQLSDSGYRGMLGRISLDITQASNITVNVSATPRTVEPGGTSILTATPGGGSSPYFYQWSVTDKSGTDAGSVDNATSASPTWTAPAQSGVYNVAVTVTDRDGNTGSGTATIQVQPLGVSISERIVKPGGMVRVPLHVTGVGSDIDAFGLKATYDITNMSYFGIEGTSDTAGWTFSVNEDPAGTLTIGGQANGNAAVPSGASADLAYLVFTTSVSAPTCTSVTISLSQGVDDISQVSLTGGTVTIVVPGDLDGSCTLTPQDALNAFLYYLGLIDLREDEAKVADVDNDGKVTPNDAILILDMYVSGS